MAAEGLTIEMSMYGGFEQVGSIGQSLPRDDAQTTTISGDIVGIVAEDMAIDGTSATLTVDCYVFGAFNAAEVTSINSLDISTAAYVLGAQGNGIYLA